MVLVSLQVIHGPLNMVANHKLADGRDIVVMDRRDILVLAGMFTGAGLVISLTVLLANQIIGNPFI